MVIISSPVILGKYVYINIYATVLESIAIKFSQSEKMEHVHANIFI